MRNSHALVNLLLSLLNDRLDLPYDQLPSLHRLASVSGDQVRWVHAPPQPRDDRKTALGQHTDFGSVTILFNRLGGLQVLPPNSNEWSYVKPLRGHAVINLGDAMVKFSAGILRSNIHRVVNPPGQQENHTRMSLVYFARPADDVILKALDGSFLIDEKRRRDPENHDEEEITSKEWILRRALGRRQGGDWTKAGGTESRRLGS
jgi:isopenicillin N synthase-like dioxygenase